MALALAQYPSSPSILQRCMALCLRDMDSARHIRKPPHILNQQAHSRSPCPNCRRFIAVFLSNLKRLRLCTLHGECMHYHQPSEPSKQHRNLRLRHAYLGDLGNIHRYDAQRGFRYSAPSVSFINIT